MNLNEAERDQLAALTRSRSVGAAYARRARLILMLEDDLAQAWPAAASP